MAYRWALALAALLAVMLTASLPVRAADAPWMQLPSTPHLPRGGASGTLDVPGARLWYAQYGTGRPVLLLHGGLANSDYWGLQVAALRKHYRVIVMDSRGHGRSSNVDQTYSYDRMSDDVVALLDHLSIAKAAIVGWSDGAVIGLDLAMHHPERVERLFAYAANTDPSGSTGDHANPVVREYLARTRIEYPHLSPTPDDYDKFFAGVRVMWRSQPQWTKPDFATIGVRTWIVDGDHDEMIKSDQARIMADWTPGAGLLIEPKVSHFAFLQNPVQFTGDVVRFLQEK
jgi:pimeloyl-ACP methyl ester carboxylesterase